MEIKTETETRPGPQRNNMRGHSYRSAEAEHIGQIIVSLETLQRGHMKRNNSIPTSRKQQDSYKPETWEVCTGILPVLLCQAILQSP